MTEYLPGLPPPTATPPAVPGRWQPSAALTPAGSANEAAHRLILHARLLIADQRLAAAPLDPLVRTGIDGIRHALGQVDTVQAICREGIVPGRVPDDYVRIAGDDGRVRTAFQMAVAILIDAARLLDGSLLPNSLAAIPKESVPRLARLVLAAENPSLADIPSGLLRPGRALHAVGDPASEAWWETPGADRPPLGPETGAPGAAPQP